MSDRARLHVASLAVVVVAFVLAASLAGKRNGPREPAPILRELGAAYAEEMRFDDAERVWSDLAARPDATPHDLVGYAGAIFGRWVKGGDSNTTQAEKESWARHVKELCEQALARDDDVAAAHYMIGVLAVGYAIGLEPADGVPHLRRAVALAPDDSGARYYLGSALEGADERDEAIACFEQIAAKGREFTGAYYGPSIYRLSQLLRRRSPADAERAAAYGAEHKLLPKPPSQEQETRDQQLGRLGRVRIATRQPEGEPAAVARSAVAFDGAGRKLLEQAGRVSSIGLGDLDDDGRDDVVVAGERGAFAALAQADGTWKEIAVTPKRAHRVVVADLENDGGAKYGNSHASVLLLADAGVGLFSPRADGSFVDDSAKLPQISDATDLEPVDFDHDGHLDLLFATTGGLRLVRNRGVKRDEDGRPEVDAETQREAEIAFEEVTELAGLLHVPASWVAIEDFDGDQDVDLLVGGTGAPTTLFSNLRRSRFERLPPAKSRLPAELATEPLLGDVDGDGIADVVALGATTTFSRGRGDATFEEPRARPDLTTAPGARGELVDVDLDGTLDLVAHGGTGSSWWPSARAHGEQELPLPGRTPFGSAPLLADVDRDLALDVIGVAERGIEWFRGALADPPLRVLLALRGRKDNHGAIGTVTEVRAGNRYQRRFVRQSTQLFGLARDATLVLRFTWPDGVVQYPLQTDQTTDLDLHAARGDAEIALPPDVNGVTDDLRGVVEQKKGPPGSCPFLYAWDGTKYAFVTDVLGTTPLGLPIDETHYVEPDHDELVRLTSAQLAPRDGEYRLQLTEELRETTYLDRAQLWVVDHAAAVEVHPEERFCFPPFPAQQIHALRDVRPLVRAVDQAGRDWSDALARADDVPAVPFTPFGELYRGIASLHALELTLPDAAKSARRVRLLMTGWLQWGDASVNLAAAHNGTVQFLPPVVSAPDGRGGWRDCGPPVGFPAGKTKTMVLDVTSMVNRADPRLRFTSTLELYWDQIRVAIDEGEDASGGDPPITITKLEPKLAQLWFRGFSQPLPGRRPEQPLRFDWERLEENARWNQHRGLLTRYGDVAPLLGAIDDRYVLFSSGDAIDLRFDASAVAPPQPGMARTFLLFVDGWAKDADPNTSFAQTVEPLPFHAMSGYPYGADEHFPDDADHQRWRREWNTRPGRRLIPDLAAASSAGVR